MIMNGGVKQPSVKLIPSDPMTNTILIIYCVSSSGASVSCKAIWRRTNPKKGRTQQIKNQSGSSYRCSPLDLYCIIEATVVFQHNNKQISKLVQSNIVKVSRQLKERKTSMKNPIHCRVSLNEIPIQAQILVQEDKLLILSRSHQQSTFTVSVSEVIPEAQSNNHMFKIYFKSRFEEFLNFYSLILGRRPEVNQQYFFFVFNSDIARDIVLLGIAQAGHQPQINYQKINILLTPPSKLNLTEQRLKTEVQSSEKAEALLNRMKNRSQTSLSPVYNQGTKTKILDQANNLKGSFSDPNNQKKCEAMGNNSSLPSKDMISKPKDREYLNIFEEEDTPQSDIPILSVKPSAIDKIKDQPSLNLRDSFQELQRSFSNIPQQRTQKTLGSNSQSPQRQHQEIEKLKKQNQFLRKQVETVNNLSKENSTIKKMYYELKEDINRLQMEKKVILTDKLRCEVNWHKEIQEKENLRKELEHMKQRLKNAVNSNFAQENLRKNSGYEVLNTERPVEKKERGRSPNSNFYGY